MCIQRLAHTKFLLAQKIHRLIQKHPELEAYDEVDTMIENSDYEGLVKLVTRLRNTDYATMRIGELRNQAYLRGVPYAATLSRKDLIHAITIGTQPTQNQTNPSRVCVQSAY